ncbi:MAG: YbaK/EbsC family protein, partial [SAR324 cluster bacterium]|nr:YbaK/EbsC family protein [SAR324 cluster bacterium]
MNQQLSAKAANFQEFLSSRGIEEKVVELSESTRTSAEAAAAIGCEVEEIAKSIVFYVMDTLRPILVIASGTNRVDEKKLKKLVGGKMKRAD